MHKCLPIATRLIAGLFVTLGLLAMTTSLASCERDQSGQPIWKRKPADKVYTTRALVESLPDPKRPTAQFVVHHEAIDEFENPGGARGMNAMIMPMNTPADLQLGELKVGNKIEMDLSVWYAEDANRIAFYQATRVKKLPADTVLKFERAAPTLGGPPSVPETKP